jgi:hypothetical protein
VSPFRSLFLIIALPSLIQAVTIARKSSPVFYIDSSETPMQKANYVAYLITNDTASPISDVWVQITTSGTIVSLAPTENGITRLGSIAPGQAKTAFFFLRATAATTAAQTQTWSDPQK